GTGQLHGALRSDPEASGRGPVRTRPAAAFLERRPPRLELAADQSAAAFRPPLQARPPLSAAADLRNRRGAATALRLPGDELRRAGAAGLAAGDEPEGAGVAAAQLSRDRGLESL